MLFLRAGKALNYGCGLREGPTVKTKPGAIQTLVQVIGALLVLVALIFFVFLFIASIAWAMASIFGLPKELVAAIIAAMLTVGGSVGGLIWSHRDDRKKEREQKIREHNTSLYAEFMEISVHAAMNVPPGKKKPGVEEIMAFGYDWIPKMLVWGSAAAIKGYLAWRNATVVRPATTTPKQPLPTSLRATLHFFRILRADLGHDDHTLTNRDLISVIINDADDYLIDE
jgi:hypothetical protein